MDAWPPWTISGRQSGSSVADSSGVSELRGGTGALVAGARVGVRSQARPNVLFILADDLGYGDLSCYGRPDYQTPVLDALARQGVTFTSAYAAAPVCTPTRCAFVTGRFFFSEELPVGRRHSSAGDREVAGNDPTRPDERSAGDHDGLDGDDARGYRDASGPRVPPGWRRRSAGLHRRARTVRSDALLANADAGGSARRQVEGSSRSRGAPSPIVNHQ
jgi:hypothetical protein